MTKKEIETKWPEPKLLPSVVTKITIIKHSNGSFTVTRIRQNTEGVAIGSFKSLDEVFEYLKVHEAIENKIDK